MAKIEEQKIGRIYKILAHKNSEYEEGFKGSYCDSN